jgi:pimeloyl-ACP methyl ester carboxylesterase
MKQIYLFSGLGADYRAFEKLDFTGYETHHIQWIQPENRESIAQYAKRISGQIKTENPILIGLSFGGMVAVEVSKLVKTEKVILIASAKTKFEIPFYYRWAGQINLHKVLPLQWLIKANAINDWAFGVTSNSDKLLLKSILKDTDLLYLKWALNALVKWSNTDENHAIYHIHGTSDKILPFRYVNSQYVIKIGGHLMTVNKAALVSQEVSKILRQA